MKKSNIKNIIPLAIMLLVLTASYALSASGNGKGNPHSASNSGIQSLSLSEADSAEELDLDLCAREEISCLGKDTSVAVAWRPDSLPRAGVSLPKTITAWTTKFSRADSCHNRKGDKCLTAIGQDTQEGITVACPRRLKLGTKVRILEHIYTCHDRYAQWVQNRQGDTFDIFTEDYNEAIKFGKQKLNVEIII